MNKAQKIVLISLSAILLVMISLIVVLKGRQGTPIVGDFVAPQFEQTAVVGVPTDIDPSLNFQDMKVEDKINVGMCGNLTLKDDGTVDVYFTSYSENAFWAKVKMYDADGNLLGESGLIKAGEYVKSIKLTNPPEESTAIITKVLTYEEETYYSKGSVSAQMMLNVK